MQLEFFFDITVSISYLKNMSTLLQNNQMDYLHPVSKLGPGVEQLIYHKAKQLTL